MIHVFTFASAKRARQRIHMKHQALFSSKDESKKYKVSAAAILLGTLRVRTVFLRCCL